MILLAPSAWCDLGQVSVVDPDPRVLAAIEVALSPWSLKVVRVPGPLPEADIASAAASARAIADAQHAGAVVWVARPRGTEVLSLWVYDAQTGQLVVRPLSVAAPFDDAGAAAVALSVKTIMRASPLVEHEAPTAAIPAAPAPPPPTLATGTPATPRLPSPTPSPTSVTAPATAPPGPVAAPTVPRSPPPGDSSSESMAAPPSQPAHVWRFEAIVGARAPTGAATAAEPQAALGVSVWPAAFRRHAGAGALVQAGPGVTLDGASFRGQFTQACFVLTARARAATGPFAFEAQAGPALRLTSIDGAALENGASFHDVRLNPTFDAGGVLDVALSSHIALGAQVDFSALIRAQSYTLNGTTLFHEPAVDVLFGARLAVEVD